jgi:hypothetical protein
MMKNIFLFMKDFIMMSLVNLDLSSNKLKKLPECMYIKEYT